MREFWFLDPDGNRIDPLENEEVHGDIAERIIKESNTLNTILENVCSSSDICRSDILFDKYWGYPFFLRIFRVCTMLFL